MSVTELSTATACSTVYTEVSAKQTKQDALKSALEVFTKNLKAHVAVKILTKKLARYDSYDKSAEEIAKDDLFKTLPSYLTVDAIANKIFNQMYFSPYNEALLVDAFLLGHPSETLSPFNQVRRIIAADKQHTLTNDALMTVLRQHQLDTNAQVVQACFDFAFHVNHPNLYVPPKISTPVDQYTLNFLWVNLNPQDRIKDVAVNIFGYGLNANENAACLYDPKALRALETSSQSDVKIAADEWSKIKASFTYRLSKWAEAHPKAQINLWYDSALVTKKAQQKTMEMIKEISKSRGVNLKLRDIRRLPSLSGETENSLHPGAPVYYRVDLLKVLIADHMISDPKETAQYCVMTDIDVTPMPVDHLFDQRTLKYLSSPGYVFNRVGYGPFENNFFIFNKNTPDLKKHHHKIIEYSANTLKHIRNEGLDTTFYGTKLIGSQTIYSRYNAFLDKMDEDRDACNKDLPRKVVKTPPSQFIQGFFADDDHRKETFRFFGGNSKVPCTKHGRAFVHYGHHEGPIKELINWKNEPLPDCEETTKETQTKLATALN